MRLLRAGDHRRMAWKNGGGETLEVAVVPEGGGLGAFDWRVSIATVAAGGPFSTFPGVDRTLAVLSGTMELTVAGLGTHVVSPERDPLAFPADAATSARLPAGPVTDLNAMTRRGAFVHRMTRLGSALETVRARWTVVVAAADVVLAVDGVPVPLGALDAALLETPATLSCGSAAAVFAITIDPAAG